MWTISEPLKNNEDAEYAERKSVQISGNQFKSVFLIYLSKGNPFKIK